jgi:hypothetical protein
VLGAARTRPWITGYRATVMASIKRGQLQIVPLHGVERADVFEGLAGGLRFGRPSLEEQASGMGVIQRSR